MKSDDKKKADVVRSREQVAKAIKNGIIHDHGASRAAAIIGNALRGLEPSKPMRPKYRELAHEGGLVPLECPKCQERFGLSIKFLDEHSGVLIHFSCPYCQFEGSIDEK